MSQNATLIKHMQKQPITTLEAFLLYRCPNLRSRVSEIEKKGYEVQREWVELSGKRLKRYWIRRTE